MPFLVIVPVPGNCKTLLANSALIRLITCMLSHMRKHGRALVRKEAATLAIIALSAKVLCGYLQVDRINVKLHSLLAGVSLLAVFIGT